jgi:hypothetical protein
MRLHLVDDIKTSTRAAMGQAMLTTVAVTCFLVALAFLCAAGFIVMRDQYGIVEACLADAGLFVIVALIVVGVHAARKRQIERRAAERSRSAAQALLSDPVMVATGIQIIRAVGVKRLLPILAVGGLALGLMAGRNHVGTNERAPAE